MEAIVILGAVIVVVGAAWSLADLLRDCGVEPRRLAARQVRRFKNGALRQTQACSGLRSRDISSSTACRAGLSPYSIS